MTTSQKAKYIFSAILSAALFLFLFFVILFLIGAFLITLLTLIGISSESDSFNIGKLLGIALSLLYGLRDDFSFVLAYLMYIVAFSPRPLLPTVSQRKMPFCTDGRTSSPPLLWFATASIPSSCHL